MHLGGEAGFADNKAAVCLCLTPSSHLPLNQTSFSLALERFEDLLNPGTAECYRGFKALGEISYSGAEERVWALQFDKLETPF